jgi:DNA transposition AAA+ family ATPase
MSYTPIYYAGGFATLRPTTEADAKHVIAGIDAYIRTHATSHRQLAELCETDAAAFTLFVQNKMPADWAMITRRADEMLGKLYRQERREAMMPIRTPVVRATLAMADLLIEDGGIALLQGDSGTGKTEAVRAVALQHPRAIMFEAATARARVKPMLEDIGLRLGVGYASRSSADTFYHVRERLRGCSMLIVDEAHKYIGNKDCLNTLADLLKQTNVPQLWTATGDLRRYLDRGRSVNDPLAQVRSRISHTIDLADVGGAMVGIDDVKQLAADKFGLKLDAAAARELCNVATLDDEGSLRLVENTLKHAKRLAKAGNLATVDLRLVRASMDRSLTKRTRERVRRLERPATPATPAATTPAIQTTGGLRATA